MSTIETLFLQASRLKLRFPSSAGDLTTEDLWDLPVTSARTGRPSLENIGNTLLAQQREIVDTSILSTSTTNPAKQRVDLSVEVVRFVIQTKQAEAQAKEQAETRRQEKTRLDDIIRQREAQETPLDELRQRRDQM